MRISSFSRYGVLISVVSMLVGILCGVMMVCVVRFVNLRISVLYVVVSYSCV